MTPSEREAALSRCEKKEENEMLNKHESELLSDPAPTAEPGAVGVESQALSESPATAPGAKTAQAPNPPNRYDITLRVRLKVRFMVPGYSITDAITTALIQAGVYGDTPGMHVEVEATRL